MQNKSLKVKFILFTLAVCLLCLLMVTLVSYWTSYNIVKQETDRKLTESVLKNASEMNTWFGEQSTILHVIAQSIELQNDFSDEYLLSYLSRMLKQQDSVVVDYYLGFVDPQRKFIDGSGWIPPPEFDRYSRKWYQGAIKNNGLVFTTPYLDASTKKMIVTIAEPVRHNNRIVGVVAADIWVSNLMELTRTIKGNGIDYAFLLDQEGNFLVHPHQSLQPAANELKNINTVMQGHYRTLADAIKSGNGTIVALKDFDGQDKFFFIGKIKTSNWTVGVAIPKREYSKPLNKILWGFLIALALAVGTGLIITRLTVNSLLHPIKKLQYAVARFTQKDFAVRAPVYSSDEIGELGTCFNTMAATIEEYNHNLEGLVAERTRELEEKNQHILESFDYARRIQQSILPDFSRYLLMSEKDYFVIWKPRDIVGGDLYWSKQMESDYFVSLFDCTGHGVPGALMTMTVNAILDRIVDEVDNENPAHILQELNKLLRRTLGQDNSDAITNDGVDLGLCLVKPKQNKLIFAGAKISLFYCCQGEVLEIKGDRQSLGYKKSRPDFVYNNHEIDLKPGQVFYLTTDGFIDQNGEGDENGFGYKRFRQMLLDHYKQPLNSQKDEYHNILNSFMGSEKQRDDISFIGFAVSKIENSF